MKHLIISKFKPEFSQEKIDEMLPEIRRIFRETLAIHGVTDVRVLRNCVARSNRYDLMIEITMDQKSLAEYDACAAHKEWKNTYGDMLEKKTIFDYED